MAGFSEPRSNGKLMANVFWVCTIRTPGRVVLVTG